MATSKPAPDAALVDVGTPEAAGQGTPQSLPRLGEPAPQFEAVSTHGPIKLSDFKGSWVVLFSHPADFTPVCTTELVELARKQGEFKKIGAQLIGLSIDSIYSHIAWIRNMEEKFDVSLDFPIIADLNTKVAHAYGMIHPVASETATVRCVFIIDDKQVIRAMTCYPLTNGRSVDEILRAVQALQTTTQKTVSTPEGWKPGDEVIVPPPLTTQAAAKRLNEGYQSVDWYFSKKKL